MPSKSSGPTGGANDTQDVDPHVDPNETDVTPDVTPPTTELTEPQVVEEKVARSGAYDLVRARDDKTGVEQTVARIVAKRGDLKILEDKPALDEFGRPLPPRSKPTNRTDKAGTPAQEA